MSPKNVIFVFAVSAGLLFAGQVFSGRSQNLRPSNRLALLAASRPKSAPGRILVKFKKLEDVRLQESTRASIESALGIQEIKKFTLIDVSLYRTLLDTETTLLELQANPLVEYAEPDYFRYAQAIFPNDPAFTDLWGLHNTGQNNGTMDADIDAPEAWGLSTGSADVVVAVIDSGVDYNHEDLKANMWKNPGEIPGNGLDDDNNGYVDDVYGIDAIDDSGDPLDDEGHGTHISGTIAAVGNNGTGVAGVCWNCKIMALRFLSSNGGGRVSDEIECIEYALKNGAKIINCSFGEYSFAQTEKDAIDAARNSGLLFMFAVGNDGENNDIKPHYPSSYDSENIIAVGISDRNDQLVSWSDYGLNSVDVAAPGVDILSTHLNNGYEIQNGSSTATPHVTGLAALLKSFDPTLSWLDIKNLILSNGDKIPSAEGKLVTGKRINANKALRARPDTLLFLQAAEGGTTSPAPGLYTHQEDENISILAIPDSGFEFLRWSGSVLSDEESGNPLHLKMNSSKLITANFKVLIFAPLRFGGQKVENRSLSQRETLIVLNWQPHPNNSDVEWYRLYEISGPNWKKLSDIDASLFSYQHRGVDKNRSYTYALVAVDTAGVEGAPATLTVH